MGVIFQSGMAVGAVPGFSNFGVTRGWLLGTEEFGNQPAWDNGVMTLIVDDLGVTDFINVINQEPEFALYISGIDSMGTDQSTFLSQVIGNEGTMTFSQGGASVTIGFDETTFQANNYSSVTGIQYDMNGTPPNIVNGTGIFYGFNNAGNPNTEDHDDPYNVQPSNAQVLTITINLTTTTPTPTPTVTITPTPTPTSGATPAGFLTFSEVGSDVVMTASGTIDLSGLTLVEAGAGPLSNGGLGPNTATYIMGTTGTTFDLYSGFTTNPTSLGTGSGLSASSSIGDVFGVITPGTPPYQLAVPLGYTSGTNISCLQTFTGATFSSLGLTQGTYTYTWGSGKSFNVIIGNGVNPTPTTTPTNTETPTNTPTPTSTDLSSITTYSISGCTNLNVLVVDLGPGLIVLGDVNYYTFTGATPSGCYSVISKINAPIDDAFTTSFGTGGCNDCESTYITPTPTPTQTNTPTPSA
jgi:hypothetical protein